MAIYNDRPQSGRLNGLSPVQMLERKIEATGFVARVPDEEAFDIIFSREEERVVRQGTLTIGAGRYTAPFFGALLPGTKVTALVPLRRQSDRVFVRHGDKDLGWAEAMPTFKHGDSDRARRQSRLERDFSAAVQSVKEELDEGFDGFDLQKRSVEKIAPHAPAPDTWMRAIDKTAPKRAMTDLEDLELTIKEHLGNRVSVLTEANRRRLSADD